MGVKLCQASWNKYRQKFEIRFPYAESKAKRKLTRLSRMLKFLTFEKRRVLIKAYFESQFKHCPLVGMFHGRQVNNEINCLHERALRMICEDSTSLFDTLLEKDKSFSSMIGIFNKLHWKCTK